MSKSIHIFYVAKDNLNLIIEYLTLLDFRSAFMFSLTCKTVFNAVGANKIYKKKQSIISHQHEGFDYNLFENKGKYLKKALDRSSKDQFGSTDADKSCWTKFIAMKNGYYDLLEIIDPKEKKFQLIQQFSSMLLLAIYTNQISVIKYLMEYSFNVPPLLDACQLGLKHSIKSENPVLVKYFLDKNGLSLTDIMNGFAILEKVAKDDGINKTLKHSFKSNYFNLDYLKIPLTYSLENQEIGSYLKDKLYLLWMDDIMI